MDMFFLSFWAKKRDLTVPSLRWQSPHGRNTFSDGVDKWSTEGSLDKKFRKHELQESYSSFIMFYYFFLAIEQLLTWTYRWPGPNADASSHKYLEFAAHAIAYPPVCAPYGIDNVSGAFPGNKTGCDAHQIGPGDKETAQDWHGDFRDATWFNRVW